MEVAESGLPVAAMQSKATPATQTGPSLGSTQRSPSSPPALPRRTAKPRPEAVPPLGRAGAARDGSDREGEGGGGFPRHSRLELAVVTERI